MLVATRVPSRQLFAPVKDFFPQVDHSAWCQSGSLTRQAKGDESTIEGCDEVIGRDRKVTGPAGACVKTTASCRLSLRRIASGSATGVAWRVLPRLFVALKTSIPRLGANWSDSPNAASLSQAGGRHTDDFRLGVVARRTTGDSRDEIVQMSEITDAAAAGSMPVSIKHSRCNVIEHTSRDRRGSGAGSQPQFSPQSRRMGSLTLS